MNKYKIDSDVKSLVGKNIKDGYVFSGTKGVIKSYSEKKEMYSVTVKYINGETLDVEYKEDELILADLDTTSTNKEVEDTKAQIKAINKKSKKVTITGCAIVLALLIASIPVAAFVREYVPMIITLVCLLVVVLAIGITMLCIVYKNEKKLLPLYRKVENVILMEREEEISKDQNSDAFADIQKLKTLLDSGAITPKEFETTKKELLKSITRKEK